MPAQSSHISKAARQVVPAFLQKLYEMVNDPNNAELIRWSEAGDSFFVLDHERFAHEVLGRWFKHRNFSSFVRQLNMYGFHKIPHLQQGVLKSDTDTEFWNFAHANFHRGQPDLLCLIQRKKQVAQPGDEGSMDLRDGANAGVGGVGLLAGPPPTAAAGPANGSPSSANLSSGQILDIQSIVNGISAIKRHQTTISSELNELKRSNQMLWQDALQARAKHQKQQDTINRIVKFLAGVFGNHAGTAGVGVAAGSPGVGPGVQHGREEDVEGGATRRKMRLMIEDAKRDGPRKSMIEELTEIPLDTDTTMYDYPTIETPLSVASPAPSVAMSDNNVTVQDASSYFPSVKNDNAKTDPVREAQPQPQQLQQQQQQQDLLSRSVTPTRHSPTTFEFDPRISGVLNQLSPLQIQQLLASLAAQTISDPTPSSSSVPVNSDAANATANPNASLTQYQPPAFDFPSQPPPSYNPNMPMNLVSPDELISFDNYDPGSPSDMNHLMQPPNLSADQQDHEQRMDRQWSAAEDIDKDVNALNSSIHSLIQTFGLDPSLLDDASMHSMGRGQDELQQHPIAPNASANPALSSSATNGVASDFDFDSFFNNLTSTGAGVGGHGLDIDTTNLGSGSGSNNTMNMDYSGDLASTAFLDEVQTPTATTASQSTNSSPVQPLRQVSPEMNLGRETNDDVGISSGVNSMLAGSGGVGGAGGGKSAGSGRKRKSEVIMENFDVGGGDASESTVKTGTKSKRRKDR